MRIRSALLGPNGAGKTTLIHIVCGIVTPSGGSVVTPLTSSADFAGAFTGSPTPA